MFPICYGDKNSTVYKLQQLLNANGAAIATDGDYGEQTLGALHQFQQQNGLPISSSVDEQLWLRLGGTLTENGEPEQGATVDEQATTWDHHSDRRIGRLHPSVRAASAAFINKCYNELGKTVRVTSSFRSEQEQAELYAKGRTTVQLEAAGIMGVAGKPNEGRVTNAKPGSSYHNYGLAIDVVEIKNNQALYGANPDSEWQRIGDAGKSLGFEWGGDWTGLVDKPHFQMTFGLSIAQLKELIANGNHTQGFVNIP